MVKSSIQVPQCIYTNPKMHWANFSHMLEGHFRGHFGGPTYVGTPEFLFCYNVNYIRLNMVGKFWSDGGPSHALGLAK